jgi:hypothetical protein
MLCAVVVVRRSDREGLKTKEPTLLTPTLLARLPPSGAFLVLPAAGAL